ncbi:MAG: HDIG domain-containing protein [Candidatus Nealsonbacteria bacterium]|nr:HDIG domain-containing protein [Candidatus Nealsonbacteria bacterium]
MNREEAFNILKENLSNQNLIKHSLAVEAIMRVLARHFGKDQEKWALAGLLHDIDYDKVKNDLSQHSLAGAQMLEKLGLDKDICQAVKVHNEAHGIAPETIMEKALFVTDPLTGLIVAAALVLPSKKLNDLTPENVLNRFKEKAFARGANREIIKKCEDLLNLKLEEFVKVGLEAMQKSSQELGL